MKLNNVINNLKSNGYRLVVDKDYMSGRAFCLYDNEGVVNATCKTVPELLGLFGNATVKAVNTMPCQVTVTII